MTRPAERSPATRSPCPAKFKVGACSEQRQMVAAVIEALFLLYGQDYKAGGWSNERGRDEA